MPTIYIRLLNERTDVWRPVEAEHLGDDRYRITSVNGHPETEVWQFRTDEEVHCIERSLSGGSALIAYIRRDSLIGDTLFGDLRPWFFWSIFIVWQVGMLGDLLFWLGAPDKFNVMNAVALMAAGLIGTSAAYLTLLVCPAVRGFVLRKGANVTRARKVAVVVCLVTGCSAFACVAYWYRAYMALP